jgi:hypothetical protein
MALAHWRWAGVVVRGLPSQVMPLLSPLPFVAMKRLTVVLLVVVLAACSSDDEGGGGSSEGWLGQWPGDSLEVDGHQVKVDEDERIVYVEDCGVARELTEPGGPYGPADGEAGYAYICE